VKRGFSLLELLVALVIMTIMSGVVMTSIWPALGDARMRAGAGMVIAALRYARSYAVTHRTETKTSFDTERQGVSVLIPERDEQDEETWRVITTPAGRFRSLPSGVTITVSRPDATGQIPAEVNATDQHENQETITFTALGQAEDARITLDDTRGNSRVIRVDAITGHCELVSEEP